MSKSNELIKISFVIIALMIAEAFLNTKITCDTHWEHLAAHGAEIKKTESDLPEQNYFLFVLVVSPNYFFKAGLF